MMYSSRFSLLLLVLAGILCVCAQPKTPNILYLISGELYAVFNLILTLPSLLDDMRLIDLFFLP